MAVRPPVSLDDARGFAQLFEELTKDACVFRSDRLITPNADVVGNILEYMQHTLLSREQLEYCWRRSGVRGQALELDKAGFVTCLCLALLGKQGYIVPDAVPADIQQAAQSVSANVLHFHAGASQLQCTPPPAAVPATAPQAQRMRVDCGTADTIVKLRRTPTANAFLTGASVAHGDEVMLLGTTARAPSDAFSVGVPSDAFVRVSLNNGTEGWLKAKYLRGMSQPASSATSGTMRRHDSSAARPQPSSQRQRVATDCSASGGGSSSGRATVQQRQSRPKYNDPVKVVSGEHEGRYGRICHDAQGHCPYKVRFHDGVAPGWLGETQVEKVSEQEKTRGQQAEKAKAKAANRPNVTDPIKVVSGEHEGRYGRICHDAQDNCPYKVHFHDGEVSDWLGEDDVEKVSEQEKTRGQQAEKGNARGRQQAGASSSSQVASSSTDRNLLMPSHWIQKFAGQHGFAVFHIDCRQQAQLWQAMKKIMHVPDPQNLGWGSALPVLVPTWRHSPVELGSLLSA